jgi:xanthine/CO dehydrogenase XdhC/CoxF family maturation factor
LRRAYEDRETVDSAVAISIRKSEACTIGERFFLDGNGPVEPVPGLMDDLHTFSGSASNYKTIRYEEGDSLVEFAFETIRPPVRILILGAGADAVPLADAAHSLGWQVNVCDHRPAFLTQARFPNAEQLVILDRDSPVELQTDELTAIVVMNHNYERDKTMLVASLRSEAFYVGALGPKKRTAQMLDELDETPDPERLRAPAGLDIGAETPEAIAISIVAEVQSVLKHRDGGPLRDRQAPIYDRK